MKLALVTETYPPEINGVAMTLHRLVSGLANRGHQIEVIRPRQAGENGRPEQNPPEGGVVHCLVPGLPIPFYKSLRIGLPIAPVLRRRWKTNPPQVVHVATEGPLGLAALYSAGHFKLPITSSFHTNFHQYGGHYGLKAAQELALRYLRWFHNRTRCTLVPTDQMLAQLREDGFQRLSVLARGVDGELFSPRKRSLALRKSWQADASDPVMIYVGRIAAEKNLGLAVEAFLTMQAEIPSAKFVLVGDGPLRATLEKKYPEFNYAGSRRGEELARYYASADVFIFPSTTETFGNVITEALASGLVVLSYDYAAGRQFIRSSENGFLADFDDHRSFVTAARQLIARREEWPRVRAAARATALTITWATVIDRFEAELARAANVPLPLGLTAPTH